MNLTHEEMLATLGTRDPANNGKFIIGVLSTGIYCLPSCHARTPKPENVRFFDNGAAAEAAGLRPCKKCKPDEYERGENRELDSLEALVARVLQDPSQYGSTSELASDLDVGSTKLHALFRLHYQRTPAEYLSSARINAAKRRLIDSTAGIAEVAYDVGYESLSVFNGNFRRSVGMTPSAYRALLGAREFGFEVPDDYNVESFVRNFGRDPASPTERCIGARALMATPAGSVAEVGFERRVEVRLVRGEATDAYESLARMMHFSQDAGSFEAIASELGIYHLVDGRIGSRLPQTPSLFDGLIWAVTGQQINLPFAFSLRRRLFERFGEPLGDNLFAVPTPERLTQADMSELTDLQFSRQKSDYLLGIARLGEGWINAVESASFTRAKCMLLATRGIGMWSSNYILMRSLGFPDCVPLGDTGLTAGLARLHGLESKPTISEIEQMMAPFAPHRSLATYHLWQSLK